MKNLKVLFCEGDSGLNDESIKGLDLIELYADNNPKIKNIRNMKNLKILSCERNCGIGDADIKDLDLIKLDARYNSKVTIKI